MPARSKVPRRPVAIGILLLDRFAMSQFGMFTDVLRWAADEGDQSRQLNVRWSIMSARMEPVTSSCGAGLIPTTALIDPKELDYIAIMGGPMHSAMAVGDDVLSYLRAAAQAGVTLIGACTAGTFVLHRAGLMEGRRSCVSWYHYPDFVEQFPNEQVVADRLFLVDNGRITCAGGSANADLATHLVAQHVGQSMAQKASHFMLVDRPRAGNELQPHAPIAANVRDPRVRRALLLMEQHLARPLSMTLLAQKLRLSLRQMERLFEDEIGSSPAALYRAARMRHAAWLLSHTQRPVTEIALSSGFADGAHFSREFRRVFGAAPSHHRLTSPLPTGELVRTRIF